ncbi:DUF6624 domain-containing protein [Filimonas lacunae]|nr:DUF6624 domain-containing protein [Filimonas lacunae]BAV06965.1 hypothetical protein FLA_2985 [Filimonas lacunae]
MKINNSNAKCLHLALLEDRINIQEGRSQTYDSQLSWNFKTNTYQLLPIIDPDNLDKRRATMGLNPYASYLQAFGITWNLKSIKNHSMHTINTTF